MLRVLPCLPFALLFALGSAPAATATSPTITITSTPAFGAFGSLQGTTTRANPATHRVATYIHIEGYGWVVKPTLASPTVPLQANGSFSVNVTTGGLDAFATCFVVALVPAGCSVPTPLGASGLDLDDPCFLATHVLERPGPILDFAGRKWAVKVAPLPVGPGPNRFAQTNACVDGKGHLKLQITQSGAEWHCAEVVLLEKLGHGTYWFVTTTPQDALPQNVTFGAFTWDKFGGPSNREIDMEDSLWNNPSNLPSQVVVQPYSTPGNLVSFALPNLSTDATLTRFMDWQPGEITFGVRKGLYTPCAMTPQTSWFHHVYATNPALNHFVPDEGDAQFRFNLWINAGSAPSSGQPVTVVVSDFRFTPARGAFPIGCTHDAIGSLPVIGGTTSLGQTLTLGVDNPAGTQTAGSQAVLAISNPTTNPLACGPLVPGWGATGAAAELVLHPTAKPVVLFGQNPWAGPDHPVPFALPIPTNAGSLVGQRFHAQGAVLDAPTSSQPVALTEGRELCIAP